jgi:hypothetical protein
MKVAGKLVIRVDILKSEISWSILRSQSTVTGNSQHPITLSLQRGKALRLCFH